jgi:hypothetical protein
MMIIIFNHEKAVRFIADDQALFVSGLGLVLDATPILGAPRAKVTHLRIGFTGHVSLTFLYSAL